MLTRNPGSSKPSRTVDRAGGSSGKNSLYASFIAAKSPGSERRTVVRTTERRPRSSSSRIDWMFRRHWRVCPPTSAAAHSPDFAPGRSGACPEMKTRPLATTQWEYGPTGFGWLGNSGIPFMIRRRGNAAGPKRIVTLGGPSEGSQIPRRVLGTHRNFPFCRCKSIRNWDVVQGGNRTERQECPEVECRDVETRPSLARRRRRGRRGLIDRRIVRQDQRSERPPHVDLFVVSERDPRRACLDPGPRRPGPAAVARR